VPESRLRIRGAGKITKFRSAATGKRLAARYANDELSLTLPRLDEGDVLLLD
jgi:hypothetical protein